MFIRSTTNGRLIDRVEFGLSGGIESVYYSRDNLVLGGFTNDGQSIAALEDPAGGTTANLTYRGSEFVSLLDVSASGTSAVVEDPLATAPCPAVIPVDPTARKTIWQPPCGRYATYEDALSPSGRYLLAYPADSSPSQPGEVKVIDLRNPDSVVSVGDGDIVDAGWHDDDTLLITERVNVQPEANRLLACSIEGDCQEVGGTRGLIAIGRVN